MTASVGYSHRTTVSVAVLTHALWFDDSSGTWCSEDESWREGAADGVAGAGVCERTANTLG